MKRFIATLAVALVLAIGPPQIAHASEYDATSVDLMDAATIDLMIIADDHTAEMPTTNLAGKADNFVNLGDELNTPQPQRSVKTARGDPATYRQGYNVRLNSLALQSTRSKMTATSANLRRQEVAATHQWVTSQAVEMNRRQMTGVVHRHR